MYKKRNLLFLSLFILGILLITGCTPKLPVLVTFDSQGGSAVEAQTVEEGGLVPEPAVPTKIGSTFGGWYKEPECTNPWDFDNDTVTADMTLYAKWISKIYALRDIGPAGGWIFYDKGSVSDGWRYLEAAPSDQSTGAPWGCYGVSISGADSEVVGTGEQNTIDIEAGCITSGTATDICANLSLGGYSDWFLPSIDELVLMYENLKVYGIGGFGSGSFYWSSSEYSADYAWYLGFYNANQNFNDKGNPERVRAARAF
jgi:uncharacterized repeat protein (TIGR02543 family)